MTREFDLSFKLYNKRISSIGILVGYTLENVFKASTIIEEIGTSLNILVVNNISILDNLELADRLNGWIILLGSNANGEFSAWQEGLNYIQNKGLDYEKIIFATDTVNVHRCFTKFRLLLFCLQIARNRNAYIGTLVQSIRVIPFFLRIYSLAKYILRNYISTFIFVG